jgi:hypothetical protein
MINPTTTQYRSAVRVQILIGLIAALTIGCQTVQFKSRLMEKNKSEGTQYIKSAAELRIYLDELTGIFSGTIEQAADHVITASPANEIKRHALLWKINGIPAAYGALFQPDPAIAIIDAWAFSMQMVDYFERGPGKADFGLWHSIASEASRKLETQIGEMVASGMPNGDTDPLQKKIQTWVLAHPIERDFLYRDTVAPQLASIIGDQAMDAMQTVGTLVIGVEELADRFTAHMNLLTKQARWQAELVVAETAGRADIEGKLAMLAGVADSVNRLLPIAEQSATLIAREREAFFEDLRQERIDVLSNIERQRLETISFVIGERATIIDDLTSERITIVDTLQLERESILQSIDAQRMATLIELESVGNRILGKARRQTEQLIDHVFIRMVQLIAISLLCTVVLVVLLGRLKGKRKGSPINAD